MVIIGKCLSCFCDSVFVFGSKFLNNRCFVKKRYLKLYVYVYLFISFKFYYIFKMIYCEFVFVNFIVRNDFF